MATSAFVSCNVFTSLLDVNGREPAGFSGPRISRAIRQINGSSRVPDLIASSNLENSFRTFGSVSCASDVSSNTSVPEVEVGEPQVSTVLDVAGLLNLVHGGLRHWISAPHWSKWPAAFFASLFLGVWLFSGYAALRDLLPLWILGPPLFSLIFWMGIHLVAYALVFQQRVRVTGYFLANHSQELFAYAATGQLQVDVIKLIEKKKQSIEEVRDELSEKAHQAVRKVIAYAESGELADDGRKVAIRILRQSIAAAEEWLLLKSEDFVDWIRITQRRLGKVLGKVF
eukprot:TRINITY_DN837_c0_g1_i1.p1 TRINITY_DN837_c0_g1~~TRINITY_DN837_c0_g1_i1.p1  ORF type:complete len:285 (+),score=20.01 TRINITY_DN837_c0_g1_i1:188-1042(+)